MCFMRVHIHEDLQSSAFLSYPKISFDLFQAPFFPAVHSFFSCQGAHHAVKAQFLEINNGSISSPYLKA